MISGSKDSTDREEAGLAEESLSKSPTSANGRMRSLSLGGEEMERAHFPLPFSGEVFGGEDSREMAVVDGMLLAAAEISSLSKIVPWAENVEFAIDEA